MSLDTHRKNMTPKDINIVGEEKGYRDQSSRARKRADMGAIIKGELLAKVGVLCSLVKSFSASANGWGRPIMPTLLGPFRI